MNLNMKTPERIEGKTYYPLRWVPGKGFVEDRTCTGLTVPMGFDSRTGIRAYAELHKIDPELAEKCADWGDYERE